MESRGGNPEPVPMNRNHYIWTPPILLILLIVSQHLVLSPTYAWFMYLRHINGLYPPFLLSIEMNFKFCVIGALCSAIQATRGSWLSCICFRGLMSFVFLSSESKFGNWVKTDVFEDEFKLAFYLFIILLSRGVESSTSRTKLLSHKPKKKKSFFLYFSSKLFQKALLKNLKCKGKPNTFCQL